MKTLTFKCNKCGATVTLQVGDFATHIPSVTCPECGRRMTEIEETDATGKRTKLNLMEG